MQAAYGGFPLVSAAGAGVDGEIAAHGLLAVFGLGAQLSLQLAQAAFNAGARVTQLPGVCRVGAGAHGEGGRADQGIDREGLCAFAGQVAGQFGQQAGLVQLAQGIGIAAAKAQAGIGTALGGQGGWQGIACKGQGAQPLQQLLGAGQLQVDVAIALGGRGVGLHIKGGAGELGV